MWIRPFWGRSRLSEFSLFSVFPRRLHLFSFLFLPFYVLLPRFQTVLFWEMKNYFKFKINHNPSSSPRCQWSLSLNTHTHTRRKPTSLEYFEISLLNYRGAEYSETFDVYTFVQQQLHFFFNFKWKKQTQKTSSSPKNIYFGMLWNCFVSVRKTTRELQERSGHRTGTLFSDPEWGMKGYSCT